MHTSNSPHATGNILAAAELEWNEKTHIEHISAHFKWLWPACSCFCIRLHRNVSRLKERIVCKGRMFVLLLSMVTTCLTEQISIKSLFHHFMIQLQFLLVSKRSPLWSSTMKENNMRWSEKDREYVCVWVSTFFGDPELFLTFGRGGGFPSGVWWMTRRDSLWSHDVLIWGSWDLETHEAKS